MSSILFQIYSWEPQRYSEAPEELKKQIKGDFDPNRVYVTCVGEVCILMFFVLHQNFICLIILMKEELNVHFKHYQNYHL